MIKELSKAACLYQSLHQGNSYSTVVGCCFVKSHIMTLSGYRNEISLTSYYARPSSRQLQVCRNVLSSALNPQATQADQQMRVFLGNQHQPQQSRSAACDQLPVGLMAQSIAEALCRYGRDHGLKPDLFSGRFNFAAAESVCITTMINHDVIGRSLLGMSRIYFHQYFFRISYFMNSSTKRNVLSACATTCFSFHNDTEADSALKCRQMK